VGFQVSGLSEDEMTFYEARGIFTTRDGWIVFKQRCQYLKMFSGQAYCGLQFRGKPTICQAAGCSLEIEQIERAAKFYKLVK